MKQTLRRWLCRKLNLTGLETVIHVRVNGNTLLLSELEALKLLEEGLNLSASGDVITFRWLP